MLVWRLPYNLYEIKGCEYHAKDLLYMWKDMTLIKVQEKETTEENRS